MAFYCQRCGVEVLPGAPYCGTCGAKRAMAMTVEPRLAVEPEKGPFCHLCGKRSKEGALFCCWCGKGLKRRPLASEVGQILCLSCGQANAVDAGFCRACRFSFGKWYGEEREPGEGAGKLFGGRYEVERELGSGGMGVVYKAVDTKLGRPVALKVIPPELCRNKAAVEILRKEAVIALELKHPNIVRLQNFEEGKDSAYLVMEFVEGRTVAEIVEERGRLSEEEAGAIGEKVLDALAYAHAKGVVHRDLKPANVMVGEGGEVNILDFGIARVLRDTMTRFTGTSGSTSGTLPYMAPEQILGKRQDARTDIYAFGVFMYEMS